MRDQFSRLLEDSGLVPSTISGGAVNNFSGNMELVKVRKAQDACSFRRFFALKFFKQSKFLRLKLFNAVVEAWGRDAALQNVSQE